MPKYRKKPVVIEAWRVEQILFFAGNNWNQLPEPIKERYERGEVIFAHQHIIVKTLEGMMTASFKDWIIKGISGELYPIKPDIFEATYEVVDE